MEDDADIYDGIRAQFPLSFGKQSKSQTPLEVLHSKTRRLTDDLNPQRSNSNNNINSQSSNLSLSSSSKAWLDAVRSSPNPNSTKAKASTSASHVNGDDGDVAAPPRPSEDDGGMVGPLPPPGGRSVADDDDEGMVGPPPPPARSVVNDDDDDPLIG